MSGKDAQSKNIYHITIKQSLENGVPEWLGGMDTIPLPNGHTILVGNIIDQVAMRGLLNQLWNHNITIISIKRSEK
jgi:hypothetical protein